ncbi:hypothetical protein W97_05319 [Coniosporium apollinis CBS 100218]|uniref:LysM domain-containing protein n=1 Tax=Coniosporium apollinis (strain CBS 100218) TaxID=1168221 RepID=R7YWP9_CONA1|nr:uncharacterized protein W97_05319 [Coniosporium apollinis CBS 100218]EON66076.1 hypothetical protein W97_05319 [Coniosporium apollinis CBS 100218]
MNPANASHSTTRTSSTPASALRPRTRRLISGLDEELGDNIGSGGSTRIPSPYESPFSSRAASPIPSTHPSRPVTSQSVPRSHPAGKSDRPGALGQNNGQDSLNALSGLWGNSWTALQGLASNVLGGDTTAGTKDNPTRRRRPSGAARTRSSSNARSAQWGPSGSTECQVGAGSREERENLVRAMKRKDLLSANGHAYPDASGRHKRRTSDDRFSVSAPPAEHDDRDALVYLHHVRPQDTLAGITIKYNCQAAVLRKANRMWPNDTVQCRRTLVLPVDACGVKGRPAPASQESAAEREEEDLLLGGTEIKDDSRSDTTPTPTPTLPNGWHRRTSTSTHSATASHSQHPPSSATSSQTESDPPWIHDSWVILPGDANPTEIARLPRRSLGYFPRARRKSTNFSESATPSTSFDLPRPSTSDDSTPTIHPPSQSIPNSPSNTTSASKLSRPPRIRSTSNTSTTSQPRHKPAFILQGPGGVGTLSPSVRSPGPAADGLNKNFAKYLPSVAPPPSQSHFTPWAPSLLDAVSPVLTPSGARSPAAGGPGAGFEIEQLGGAIEGWVRKMAGKASKAATSLGEGKPAALNSKAAKAGVGPAGLGAGTGVGDLIELTDAFEIGEDEDGVEEEVGRGRAFQDGHEVSGLTRRSRNREGSKGTKGGKDD